MTTFAISDRTRLGQRQRELAIEALRLGPWVMAGGRVVLGIAAMVKPELPTRPWIGKALASDRRVHVLARALGGRDVGLGAGALWALRRASGATNSVAAGGSGTGAVHVANVWNVAGAFADAIDVTATVASWSSLPRAGRLAVMAAAGGAVGVNAAALAIRPLSSWLLGNRMG